MCAFTQSSILNDKVPMYIDANEKIKISTINLDLSSIKTVAGSHNDQRIKAIFKRKNIYTCTRIFHFYRLLKKMLSKFKTKFLLNLLRQFMWCTLGLDISKRISI